MDKKRPIVITIISWFQIALSLLALLFSVAFFSMPYAKIVAEDAGLPLTLVLITNFSSWLIIIISALAMLKGFNFGRLIYLILTPILIVYRGILIGFGYGTIINIIFFIIIFILLTRPNVSAFFISEI
jgi:hypothetical protein